MQRDLVDHVRLACAMPAMHGTGQLRAQTVQPTHFSGSIS